MKQVVKTICQMCYFHCGLDVTVKDGRITKVEGMKESPVNRGRLCAKGLSCAQLLTDPMRLKRPLRRVGDRGSGKWEEITWNQALDEIAEKLLHIREKFGPEYVGYYRGQGSGWVTNFNYVWRFMNSWGSPNLFTHGHLCFVPRAIAHKATFGGFPEPDYEHTNCIMLVGHNPVYTSPVNYGPRIIWAKERGVKLIVVDPRFTNTASKADLYLQNRPGTSGALILAMIQVIIDESLYDETFIKQWTVGFDRVREFVQDYKPEKVEEITWVPASGIRNAARMIATIKPSVIVDGNGLDQHTNTVQTVRATSILRSLLRTVQEKGGSIMLPPLPFVDVQRRGSQPFDFYDKSVCQYPLYAAGAFGLTGVEMIDSIATEKPFGIKAVIVQGGDPVAVLSDTKKVRETLKRLDLLVVHDLYPIATSEIADYILPAASFLERDLILNYRYRPAADINLIAMQNKCVSPVGESRSDLEFIFALARRVGLGEYFPWEKITDAFDWELEPNGISVSWLRSHPGGYVRKYSPEEIYRTYEKDGFPTRSKKIELFASSFEEQGIDPLPKFVEPADSPVSRPDRAKAYPLICSTGLKLGIHTHTQFRTLPSIREIEPEPFAEIHPLTAAELGISEESLILVESPKGSMRVRARLRYSIHPRVLVITHGYGEPYAGSFDLPNLITSEEERDPVVGATSTRSFLCRVKRVEG
ncbi:MAG: molybdopterin-dependent oxidoreductase [Deltaproteobacteria bacterium]|nr:molybdopterin-dependent oxidoreductase [Deltaproteobacteria bacterium]